MAFRCWAMPEVATAAEERDRHSGHSLEARLAPIPAVFQSASAAEPVAPSGAEPVHRMSAAQAVVRPAGLRVGFVDIGFADRCFADQSIVPAARLVAR